MPPALHGPRRLAGQHVGQVPDPEAFAHAKNVGQGLLGRHGAVPGLDGVQARVAVAAGLGEVLAEVAQQDLTPAAGRFAVAQQRRQLLLLEALVAFAGLAVSLGRGHGGVVHGHQAAQHGDVAQAVGHPGHGGQAVAARASRLLVIGLQARGRVHVGHETDIGLVHAHTEGHGGDHDHALLAHEPLLVGLARGGGKAGVVRQGREPFPGQGLGRGLDLLARHAVDDAGLTGRT
ncbi:hypothetical protein DSECCO2_568620 [anaerobic digester metagenome]